MRTTLAAFALLAALAVPAAHADPSPLEGRWAREDAGRAEVRLVLSGSCRYTLKSLSPEDRTWANLMVRGRWKQPSENELALCEEGKQTWERLRVRLADEGRTLITEDLKEDGTPTGVLHRYRKR